MSASATRVPRKVRGVENRRKQRRDGTLYYRFLVRWTDPGTGSRISEEFDEQRDAIDFQAALRLARRRGGLAALNAGRETVADYADEWWASYAAHNLARSTLETYAVVWNRHALPRLGHLELRAITPGVVARFRSELEAAGVGAPTIRKTMSVLQAMLRRAVEEDRLRSNAVKQVRKPKATRQRAVRPLPPASVEQVRAAMAAPPHAVLISVLAYTGLRPEEALALEWRHVRDGTLLIEQKNVDGKLAVGQKVDGKPPRTVGLLAAARADLAEHRRASGSPLEGSLVFSRPDGQPWRATDYRNWRRRIFRPAAAAAGLTSTEAPWTKDNAYDGPVPYDLRHSFASLLIHAGELSIIEIAGQLGHSPQTLLRTYSHVFAELRGQPKIPADQQIAKARAARAEELG